MSRMMNEPYMWEEYHMGEITMAVCPECGALTRERFIHADWHKALASRLVGAALAEFSVSGEPSR